MYNWLSFGIVGNSVCRMWESCTLAFPYAVNRVIHDSIACYAHFHNASFVPPGVGLSALTDFPFCLVAFLSLPPCPLLVGFLPAVCRKPFRILRREVCPGLFNRHKLFATLSSEDFILFDFSYTESCRCSINVLN